MSSFSTVGFIVGALRVISFLAKFAPGPSDGDTPKVQIQIGQSSESDGLGGTVGSIWTFDTSNGYQGLAGVGKKIGTGSFGITDFKYNVDGKVQIGYIDIVASDDAICMAWVSLANANGVEAAWTGDYGYECDGDWYLSSVYAGFYKKRGGGQVRYTPRCTWIDLDGSNGLKTKSIKIDIASYSPSPAEGAKKHQGYCGASYLSIRDVPLSPTPQKLHAVAKKKRDNSTASVEGRHRNPYFTKYVVRSQLQAHVGGAEELCNSSTSYGADFIGPDGMYCDMGNKILSPLCSTKDVEGCIDLEEGPGTARLNKKASGARSLFRQFPRGIQVWKPEVEGQ